MIIFHFSNVSTEIFTPQCHPKHLEPSINATAASLPSIMGNLILKKWNKFEYTWGCWYIHQIFDVFCVHFTLLLFFHRLNLNLFKDFPTADKVKNIHVNDFNCEWIFHCSELIELAFDEFMNDTQDNYTRRSWKSLAFFFYTVS